MKIKTLTIPLACVAGFALAVSQASANLIVNGDFETGVLAPTSTTGYSLDNSLNGLRTGGESEGEGEYSIVNNPNFSHNLFVSSADHTPVGNLMMVVNGSGVAGKTVWAQTVVPALTVGATYEFSAWVLNAYPVNPAILDFTFGGVSLGSFTTTLTGWQPFTATFTALNSDGGVIDVKLLASGNDFALDDLSLVAVPEPTTMIAGAMLLLPFGASTLRMLRKNRTA